MKLEKVFQFYFYKSFLIWIKKYKLKKFLLYIITIYNLQFTIYNLQFTIYYLQFTL